MEYKNKFWHFNVPSKFTENTGLARWCIRARSWSEAGCGSVKTVSNVWRKLGSNGIFILSITRYTFDERIDELMKYKIKFGHCYVPQRYAENSSLDIGAT